MCHEFTVMPYKTSQGTTRWLNISINRTMERSDQVSHFLAYKNTKCMVPTSLHLSYYLDHQPRIDVRTHKQLCTDQASLKA